MRHRETPNYTLKASPDANSIHLRDFASLHSPPDDASAREVTDL